MCTSIRTLSFIVTIFLGTLTFVNQAQAQAPPCRPGTMAAVVGTSCSVGPLTFNFGNDFSGGITTPANVGFTPVINGNQVGFKLTLNFVDVSTAVQSNGHFVQFSYSAQAGPQSEIRAESVSADATVQSAGNFDFVQVADFQTFPNQFVIDPFADIDIENGATLFNQLSQSLFLEVPATQSSGNFLGGPTTQIFDVAGPGSSVSLTSATFLYTAGPLLPIPSAAALNFNIIELPGVAETFVSNITNSGRTVGSFVDTAGNTHGYTAEADGVTFSSFDFPGATRTFADGLNEQGDVVGEYLDDQRQSHGFLRHDGIFTTLDVPDSLFTAAIGINDKGQIVGEYESQDGGFHGFLFEKGTFTTIDHGPGTGLFASTAAFTINNAGQFVGEFFDPNTLRAFVQKDDAFTAQDVPGQGDAQGEGINNPGDIVGTFNDMNLAPHGYLFSKGTFFTVDFPGGTDNFPLGINASGKIVGQFRGADGLFHSYLAAPAPGNANGPNAAAVAPSAPTESCNSESWQLRHTQRHHLTACHAGK